MSVEARKVFHAVEKEFNVPGFAKMVITTSNDLNDETVDALDKQVINLSFTWEPRALLPYHDIYRPVGSFLSHTV